MNFLQQIMAKLQQFMIGRYGSDSFTLFLTISGLVCSILSNFRHLRFLYLISLILIFYGVFRTFSRNYEARRKELNWYLRVSQKPKAEIKILMSQIRDRKTHRYYKCKSCKTVLRVPKGRGKIEVTCPKCRMKAITKS